MVTVSPAASKQGDKLTGDGNAPRFVGRKSLCPLLLVTNPVHVQSSLCLVMRWLVVWGGCGRECASSDLLDQHLLLNIYRPSTAQKNSPPQLYSTIYRIYVLNYSTNYSTIFLVLSPGDIFKNSQHKGIDSQPTKIANRIANLGSRRIDNMDISPRPENPFS